MSKVLESLERLAMPDELHIKECKKLGIGLTEDYDVVEQALQRLESIDNASPSEALECLEKVSDYLNNVYDYKEIIEEVRKDIDTIKQVLLKVQEPKQYLKWEDLEFEITHKIRILMNGNLYTLFCYDEKYIEIRTIKGEFILTLDNENPEDIQFFNDLHLERGGE